jgi:hypothetical protein
MTPRKHVPERLPDKAEPLVAAAEHFAAHSAGLATDAERLVEAKESKKGEETEDDCKGDGPWRPTGSL